MDPVQDESTAGPIRRVLGSLANLLATALAIGRTRLELLSVEVQLEIQRTAEIVVLFIVAALATLLGLVIGAFWVILVFWDTHRLLAAGLLTAIFLGMGLLAGMLLARKLRAKPRFLSGTLQELAQDVERLRGQR